MSFRLIPSDRASVFSDRDAKFAWDVQYYLSQDPRQLPSRYLYDALGSCLFEAICQLPWYPITRAEKRLLAKHRREILAAAEPLTRIVELGCGSGEKLSTLVGNRERSVGPLELHLIDVSPTALAGSARALGGLDDVQVVAHEVPYEVGLAEVGDTRRADARTLVLFLGSNIGNFDPPGAEEFLREIRAALAPGDLFLLGTDLVKSERQLLLAYDDPLGITGAFNRNLLVRINRDLGGDFNLDAFSHAARWNADASRVEMHLVSQRSQLVRVEASGLEFTIASGETIWTESSYKYEPSGVPLRLGRAGFARVSQWTDDRDRFLLTLSEAV